MGKRSREKQERRLQDEQQLETVSQRRSGLEKIYFSIIEWGTYLILFTPLILVRTFFFPYVSPKTIFFRIIVDVLCIFYVLLVIANRKYLPKINVLTVVIFLFIGITILTSITGINFEKSFWSTFERMTGLLTFLHLLIFFIILISVFRERKYWERILTVSILVGVIISLSILLTEDPTSRGGGTLGNSSFMAAYLLFDIFFAIILFFSKKGWWKILYALSLIPMLWLLMFSPYELCRAAITAFWGGVVILGLGFLFYFLLSSEKKLLKRISILLIALLILAGIGISQLNLVQNKITEIRETGSMISRVVVGEIGYKAWKEKPWLGWGQENFNVPFNKYFNPLLFVPGYGGDVWYDRVHNIVLDTLVTSGLLGLFSYLAIFIVAILSLLKILPQIVEKRNAFLPLGMIVVLAVYFAQNLMVFDMISSYMMFFLSLAFIYFLITKEEESSLTEERRPGLPAVAGAVLIVASLFSIYFGNIQPARASQNIAKGTAYPLKQSIDFFQESTELSPMAITEASEQFSRRMISHTFDEEVDKQLLREGFESAAQVLEESIIKNPQDYRAYLMTGRHYNDYFHLTGDPDKLILAKEYLTQAQQLSPDNQQTYWSLAQTSLDEGKDEEAIEFMKRSIELAPGSPQSHWYLVLTYWALGRSRLALEKVKDAEEAGYDWKKSVEDLKKVIELNQNLHNDKELVELYLIGIEKRPANAQFRAGLAVAYANLGQFDKARQSAKEAIELNPDFVKELEEFLKQLPK